MKAHITNENEVTMEQVLDILEKIEGKNNPEEFEEAKKVILESGMGVEDVFEMLGGSFAQELLNREIVDTPIQLLTNTAKIPTYAHDSDACADIYADEDYTYTPGETHLLSTGIALAIPNGYQVNIYPRSGLSAKTGLRLANSVGIIDTGYRDELKIPFWNCGRDEISINKGDRVAQIQILHSPKFEFNITNSVKDIGEDRNGGFGSSGI